MKEKKKKKDEKKKTFSGEILRVRSQISALPSLSAQVSGVLGQSWDSVQILFSASGSRVNDKITTRSGFFLFYLIIYTIKFEYSNDFGFIRIWDFSFYLVS